MERGADFAWLSTFPAESGYPSEALFPPLTFLLPIEEARTCIDLGASASE